MIYEAPKSQKESGHSEVKTLQNSNYSSAKPALQ